MDRMYQIVKSIGYLRFFLVFSMLFGLVPTTRVESLQLYRCIHNGQVEFRQTTCPEGEQATTEVVEQSSGVTPIEPALRLERKPAPKAKRKDRGASDKISQRANEERCWKMEKQLEKVEQQLRGGYKASRYRELHRKQNEYEDYLRKFCRS